MKFDRKDTYLGVIRYEEQGMKGQGLSISASASCIRLGQLEIHTQAELEVFAKMMADLWKDHLKLERALVSEPPPDPIPGPI